MQFIKWLSQVKKDDFDIVGGKAKNLALMVQDLPEILVPQGFVITTKAFDFFLSSSITRKIDFLLLKFKTCIDLNLSQSLAEEIRNLILSVDLSQEIIQEIEQNYLALCDLYNIQDLLVAVRSSSTAEDLQEVSFAGQQDSFLNISGISDLVKAYKLCVASLYTQRAIIYRFENNFDNNKISMAVIVQKMVNADSAGVLFSLDTESGFQDVIVINAVNGLGEKLVSGQAIPDEYHVFKTALKNNYYPIVKKQLTSSGFVLSDSDIITLSKYALIIENYFNSSVDVEWVKNKLDNQIYIVQARHETIHSNNNANNNINTITTYSIKHIAEPILAGQSIGNKIVTGKIFKLVDLKNFNDFKEGDILVAEMTTPDLLPLIKKSKAIITSSGGRTCHAAIVCRELQIPALIGTQTATEILTTGDIVTVDCSQGSSGFLYSGAYDITIKKTIIGDLYKPEVDIMLNIADPDRAYSLSRLPVAGVGLARLEFIINSFIKVHPMAISYPEKLDSVTKSAIDKLSSGYDNWQDFFIKKLAYGVAQIACAFYPRPVVVRLTDFKTNEYYDLLGGKFFENYEENPMLGFRGASRYYDELYSKAFSLECAAFKMAYEIMGLNNIILMVPFVRTLGEAKKVISVLAANGIVRGQDGLKLFMMCEIPSNVLLMHEFSKYFDGFSIGSNDLTQLTLGLDRDCSKIANLFDERDPAVIKMLSMAITQAKLSNSYIGICGQAPSDFPEIANMLIEMQISSISLNPDSVIPFLNDLKNRLLINKNLNIINIEL